jgi:hypothetical protein
MLFRKAQWRTEGGNEINDGRLTLGDGGKKKHNTDPFPISIIGLEHKKILVRTDQAKTTKGKNVVIFNDLHS